MLQNDVSHFNPRYDDPEQSLDPAYYYGIIKKRFLYLIIPFVLVLGAGTAVALLWPPTYTSEGKILVESQQIPADLVRPTVTATAQERVQVIEQRVLTRDNLLAILDKYQIFADRRDTLSRTELLDLMRESVRIQPVNLDQLRGRNDSVTIALTVGFSHQRPDVAAKVANELLTLFLNEDARNRTNRAMETTKFLAREVQRLETDLAAVETKIADLKRRQSNRVAEIAQPQLAALKAEFAQKSAIYSKVHPEVVRLQRQIAAMEQTLPPAGAATAPPVDSSLDALEALVNQRTAVRNSLDVAAQKMSAARLGESLERDQFSERLEILEQAITPQKPVKPNRPKILGLVFLAAIMAGFGGVFAVEMFDRTIRGTRDLMSVADGHGIIAIPYISTRAELFRKKSRILLTLGIAVVVVAAGLAALHFLVRPLDELWPLLLVRLLGSVPRFM